MTPTAALLRRIGWKAPELARRLGCGYGRAHGWATDRNTRGNSYETPTEVLAWLERVARAVEREPAPVLRAEAREREAAD